MNNISKYSNQLTATTNIFSAKQRVENISILHNSKNTKILELCVGPSLYTLEYYYTKYGFNLTGNDIDKRWQQYYPNGNWIIDDCLLINYHKFSVVVFAPPLSNGCSGKREDSLMIENICPSYYKFIEKVINNKYDGLCTIVLPARSLSTWWDREQYNKLINYLYSISQFIELDVLNNKGCRKYIDIYFKVF